MKYVVHPYCDGIWFEIHKVDGVMSQKLGQFSDANIAVRVADLLNRNGLVDVPLTETEVTE